MAILRRPEVCDTPTWQSEPACARLVERLRVSRPGASFVDARGILCPDGTSRLFDEGVLLYGDSNHLSTHGSRRVADELLRQMTARPD